MPLIQDNVHIDAFLTGFMLQHTPPAQVAPNLFPVIKAGNQTDNYPIWDRANFRAPETARAAGTPSRRVNFSVSSDQFNCINHGLATEIPLEVNANADKVIGLRQGATIGLSNNFDQAWEKRVINTVTSTSNVGSSMTKTTSTTLQWNDFINSDPLGDVEIAKESIRSVTGVDANTIVIAQNVWLKMKQHPQIQGLIYPHGGGIPKMDNLRDLFEIQNIHIGKSIENTAAEGPGFDNFTASAMWDKYVFLAFIDPNPGLGVRTYGATFRWQPEGFPSPEVIASDIENKAGGKYIETLEKISFQDEKVTDTKLGYLIVDAVA